ncbi:MAG: M16 family metallopeptidase [Bacteroidota bacterium]
MSIDRSRSPRIVDAVDFDLTLPGIETFTLRNGVQVYAFNGGAEEVMSVEWVFWAGNSYESANLEAATANFLLRNGTSARTAFQINEFFEYHGAFLQRNCFNETATISLHGLSKHIDTLLPVVRELIVDSTMPADELSTYVQNMKQRLEVSLKKCDFVAGRLIDVYLFGEEHPYGRYTKADDFDSLSTDQLMRFYDRYYRNGEFMLFVAGKLPANFREQLDRYFGDLPNRKVDRPVHLFRPAEQKKYRVTNDPNGVQGAIRLARPFPSRTHPDFQSSIVLNTVFGGFFGSRLMSNIREDKGYTYGIHSYLLNLMQSSGWMISTEAGRDVCEATIAEVYKEMAVLREELVDEEELSLVKNYLMGSLLGDLDGPFQIIGRWKNLILHGCTDQYFYDSIRTIKSVTAEQLLDLSRRYLREEDFYELVVV